MTDMMNRIMMFNYYCNTYWMMMFRNHGRKCWMMSVM
jgi:hypothetical protein